jgi:hypothetical protein
MCLLLGLLVFGGMVVYKMVDAVVDPGAAWSEFTDLPWWMIVLCIGMGWAGFAGVAGRD